VSRYHLRADYRKVMFSIERAGVTAALKKLIQTVFRVDRWPELIGPRVQQAREVLHFALQRTDELHLAQVAGALTFTTVLSLVPLLAVALSLFTAFPLFADFRVALEKNVLRELLPAQYSPMILRYLNDFADKATQLTAAGLIFLLITALSMVLTVDRVFNDIWQVRTRRSLVQRALLYWGLLTLGPLAIGASLSAASFVASMSAGWTARLPDWLDAVLRYTPFVLGTLAVASAYVVVPQRRVLWRDALTGALVAAILGELMREGFAWYIRTGTVASIYGAFAALPLFLIWVYLSWLVILFGAAIAATLPRLRATRFADERRAGNRFVTAVALLRTLAQAKTHGADDGRMPLELLATTVRAFAPDIEGTLSELERLGYVSRLSGAHEGTWLLTCDPSVTTLEAAFRRFAIDPANSLARGDPQGLGAWLQQSLRADWIARPMNEVLSIPVGPEVSPQAGTTDTTSAAAHSTSAPASRSVQRA